MKKTIAIIIIVGVAGVAGTWAWHKYGPKKNKKGCGCADCQKKDAATAVPADIKGANLGNGEQVTPPLPRHQNPLGIVPPAGMVKADEAVILSADGFRRRSWM